jgi:hypothetical protein
MPPLKEIIRPDHATPHMGDSAAIESQAFPGLFEMTADDIGEVIDVHHYPFFERVQIV